MEDDPLSGVWTCPEQIRHARSPCARSRCRSPTSPGPKRSSPRGLGLKRSDATLRAHEHEALWGLAGARTRSSVFHAGGVLVELVQYLDPVGRPRPAGLPDLRSRHPQHRVRRSEQTRSRPALRSRARGWGAGELQADSPARRGRRLRQRPGPVLGRAAVDVRRLGQALGIHAATSRQAAARRHARGRADGADRRARADHMGRDRRARDHAQMGRARLRAPDRRRRIRSQTGAGPNGC